MNDVKRDCDILREYLEPVFVGRNLVSSVSSYSVEYRDCGGYIEVVVFKESYGIIVYRLFVSIYAMGIGIKFDVNEDYVFNNNSFMINVQNMNECLEVLESEVIKY